MDDREELYLSDGKYKFIFQPEKNFEFKCLRNGHDWRDLVGDNAVLALFQECMNLRALAKKLRKSTCTLLALLTHKNLVAEPPMLPGARETMIQECREALKECESKKITID